jgi:hypothetical protein
MPIPEQFGASELENRVVSDDQNPRFHISIPFFGFWLQGRKEDHITKE